MVIKQRAINDAQKEERRQAILSAAFELYQKISYEAVNMIQVAQKTGIAKGTVYLYFKTKEELFLAMLMQEFAAWFDEADACFTEIQTNSVSCTVDELIMLMGHSLKNRPTMVRLTAILHSILEQNIDFAAALQFKQMLLNRILRTGALLETCLPFVKPGQGTFVMLQVYVLLIGVQQLAEPSPIVKQVIAQKEMAAFQVDFLEYFLQALKTFLIGLEHQDKE